MSKLYITFHYQSHHNHLIDNNMSCWNMEHSHLSFSKAQLKYVMSNNSILTSHTKNVIIIIIYSMFSFKKTLDQQLFWPNGVCVVVWGQSALFSLWPVGGVGLSPLHLSSSSSVSPLPPENAVECAHHSFWHETGHPVRGHITLVFYCMYTSLGSRVFYIYSPQKAYSNF